MPSPTLRFGDTSDPDWSPGTSGNSAPRARQRQPESSRQWSDASVGLCLQNCCGYCVNWGKVKYLYSELFSFGGSVLKKFSAFKLTLNINPGLGEAESAACHWSFLKGSSLSSEVEGKLSANNIGAFKYVYIYVCICKTPISCIYVYLPIIKKRKHTTPVATESK